MIIQRNYSRTEEDDFKLNVQSRLSEYDEAMPVYDRTRSIEFGCGAELAA